MSEQVPASARPSDPIGRALFEISRFLAILGGIIVSLTALLVTVSVTGRYLIDTPVPGDYDLIAILCGCSVFAFLPYCQMVRGNVVVDFFTNDINPYAKLLMDAFGTALYLLIAILFTWRFVFGGIELWANSEVLANFNFYRWWTVPFDLFCMAVLILVIAYTLATEIGGIRNGRA